MDYDVFDVALVQTAENVDDSVTRVEDPVDRRKLKDEFQWPGHHRFTNRPVFPLLILLHSILKCDSV